MLHTADSRKETACALRLKTPRSSASIASTHTLNPIHKTGVPILMWLARCGLDSVQIRKLDVCSLACMNAHRDVPPQASVSRERGRVKCRNPVFAGRDAGEYAVSRKIGVGLGNKVSRLRQLTSPPSDTKLLIGL